jgi:hypothetical protein
MKNSIVILAFLMLLFSSCSVSRTMRDSNARLNLSPSDLEISEQYSAEVKVVKFLGIDFQRLFKKDVGVIGDVNSASTSKAISLASLPIIGSYVQDYSQSYALSKLYQEHPDFDCIVFPKFTTKRKNYILFTTAITKVESRLGKIKK